MKRGAGYTPGYSSTLESAWDTKEKQYSWSPGPKEIADRIVQHMLKNANQYSPYVRGEGKEKFLHDNEKNYIKKHVYLEEARKIASNDPAKAKLYQDAANKINIGIHTSNEFVEMVDHAYSAYTGNFRPKF